MLTLVIALISSVGVIVAALVTLRAVSTAGRITAADPVRFHATLARPWPTPVNHHRRVFRCPPDLPTSRAGNPYPTDMWLDNRRSDRHGVLRYDNGLPMKLVRRLILMLTNPGDLVVDPCVGGGTVPIGCWETGRRCDRR